MFYSKSHKSRKYHPGPGMQAFEQIIRNRNIFGKISGLACILANILKWGNDHCALEWRFCPQSFRQWTEWLAAACAPDWLSPKYVLLTEQCNVHHRLTDCPQNMHSAVGTEHCNVHHRMIMIVPKMYAPQFLCKNLDDHSWACWNSWSRDWLDIRFTINPNFAVGWEKVE